MAEIQDVNGASHGVALATGASAFPATRGIYVGTTGDMTVQFRDSSATVVLKAVAVGEHPFKIIKWTAGTAADVVGLY